MRWLGCQIPMDKPNRENSHADQGTAVLQQFVAGHRSEEGHPDHFVQVEPVAGRPTVGMGAGIPRDVRGDAEQKRQEDQRESCGRKEIEFTQIRNQAALEVDRHQQDGRTLDDLLKHPEHDKRERQREDKRAEERVAESAAGRKADEVFEVGREGSDDQCGWHQAQPSKRQRGGGVG